MAESQLGCMEDGRIPAAVAENRPEFYYSETQRAAVEELLRSGGGDGAFKTRLMEDQATDFLSAREIKSILGNFKEHTPQEGGGDATTKAPQSAAAASPHKEAPGGGDGDDDSGVHSTYWPQMSDTDVPPLDMGWPGGSGFFRGVTRVAVHTHPPKDNGPHIKEVVRRLIQEATKVVAIVMDLLTDLHILQDLMEASASRSVPVYILLDAQGVPHFLDMCCRLKLGTQHLRNIRSRSLKGTGMMLACGTLPGALSNKYMLVDGDKVVFGSYSFAWRASRIDRNMITVMTGQVVEAFDRDFRELYAVSDKLDLYEELHVARPSRVPPPRPRAPSKRPALPAATSRFQVSLGDARNGPLQVPAHKYHNPKYLLALGGVVQPARSLHDFLATSEAAQNLELELEPGGRPRVTSSERLDRPTLLPSQELPEDTMEEEEEEEEEAAPRQSLFRRLFKRKSSRKNSRRSAAGSHDGGGGDGSLCPSPTVEEKAGGGEVKAKPWWRRSPKKASKSESMQAINAASPPDPQSVKSRRRRRHKKAACAQS